MLSRNSGSDLRTLKGNSAYGCALEVVDGAFVGGVADVGAGGGVRPTVSVDFGARLGVDAVGAGIDAAGAAAGAGGATGADAAIGGAAVTVFAFTGGDAGGGVAISGAAATDFTFDAGGGAGVFAIAGAG